MATSTTPCSVCDLRHIIKRSEIWCPDCEEGLCRECKEHHSLSKASRKHVVIPINDYQKLPTFIAEIKQVCEKHNEKYQSFCKTHDIPCCRKCTLESHKQCKDVTPLEEIIQNVKSSTAMEEIVLSLEELGENIKRIRLDREENLDKISKTRKQTEEEIKRFRQEINLHLDKLQEKVLRELAKKEVTLKTDLQKLKTVVTEKEKQIKDYQSVVQKIKMYASDLQTYLGIKQIETEINKNEKFIQSLNENGCMDRTSISWTMDATLKSLVSSVKSLGEILVECKPTEIKLSKKKQAQVQIMARLPGTSFENIKLILDKKSTLNIEGIAGCSISPSGMMAFTKFFGPAQVILTDANGSVKNIIAVTKVKALDVTFIDDKTIAVTSGNIECIELIDIKRKKSKRIIHTDSSCYGITYKDGCLIYCAKRKGLHRLNLVNDEITTIFNFDFNLLSFVSSLNDRLYYTNDNNTVGCCDVKGSTIWEISDECVFTYANGITVDKRGNVFVADCTRSSIVVISPDGKQHKKLELPENTVVNPRGISYDWMRKILLVANKDDGLIFLFKVIH